MSGSNNIWPNGTEMPVKPGVKLLGDDGSQTGDVPVEHLLWAEHLGKAGGVASLGNDGKLPLSQIPVDLTGDLENTQDQIAEISGKVDGAVEAAGTEARRIASSVATQTTNAALTDQVPQRLNPYIEAAEQSKQSALAAEIGARQHLNNATDAAADASGYKSEAYNAQVAAERAQQIAEDAGSRAAEADRQAAEARAGAVAARTAAEDARRLAEAAQADALSKAQAALAAQEAAVSAQRATEVASGDVGQAKADAIAARDDAEGAKQAAEAAKASAVESSRVAQGAKDAAQAADVTANEAKLRAVDASTAAENSRIVAVNAAESATASRQAAEVAQSAAERAKANVDTLAQNANMSAQQAAQSAATAATEGAAAGTFAGAKAGADAIKPYLDDVVLNTQAAAASAKTASDNAIISSDKQVVASKAATEADASKQSAFNFSQEAALRSAAAEVARSAAEGAVASTNANATGSAITVMTKAELDALTSIPGTNPAQPLRALLLATVISEGKNYRRDSNNTAWIFESSNIVAVEKRVFAQESMVSEDAFRKLIVWAVKSITGEAPITLDKNGKFSIPAASFDVGNDPDVLLRIITQSGLVPLQFDKTAFKIPGMQTAHNGKLTNAMGWTVDVLNKAGVMFRIRVGDYVVLQMDTDGTFHVPKIKTYANATVSEDYTDSEIAKADAEALSYSVNVANRNINAVTNLRPGINHFNIHGQSLGAGYEAHPPLSIVQHLDNLMVGNSIHAMSGSGTVWNQFGANQFNPLVATVRSATSPQTLLNPEQVAALEYGDDACGETVLEGALRYLRQFYLDKKAVNSDPSLRFCATESAVGGQPIANLSPGFTPNLYGRFVGAIERVKSLATAGNQDYTLAAWPWVQGEADYAQGTTLQDYKARLLALRDAVKADVMSRSTQSRPPACFMYQTGGSYVAQTSDMSIGMAQLQFALEQPDCFMIGPAYPYNDKSGHLTANGSRWMGTKFGQVMQRVLIERKDFEPLRPLNARYRKNTVLVTFNVPCPPIIFGLPYVINNAANYTFKGLSAFDSQGDIALTAVSIVGQCSIIIKLAREPVGELHIQYANRANYLGNGNICDSDATINIDKYEYKLGMDTRDNIAALNDNPYPSNNWCVGFDIVAVNR